ncbi:MAG: threonine--tRNA ligase [bacterium]
MSEIDPSPKKMNKIEIMRHSTAHVLAAAVLQMFPEAKIGTGPIIDNGFYYDFDLPRTLIPEDLPILEKKMKKLIGGNHPFDKEEVVIAEAKKLFSEASQNYKVELIEELSKLGEKKVSVYKTGNFVDLCRGPHLDSTGEIKAFKLTKISGAYWRGDENKPMLQRIYGVAFATDKELKKHLELLAEAKKRDHRKLGKELNLFVLSKNVGSGFPLLTPKGTIIRQELEKLMREQLLQQDYKFVTTPHVGNLELYKTSGHYQKYSDTMFPPIKVDGEELMLKPMNCPHHIEIYKSQKRSYRELPLRLAEFGTVYRNEKSGELSGLTRVRSITIDDAHHFVSPDQLQNELNDLIKITKDTYKALQFTNFRVTLSLRDPKNKKNYIGDDKLWEKAENDLREAVKNNELQSEEILGEAAFYGPKIDFLVTDVLGREWQLTTIQIDYSLPERFRLKYTDDKNKEVRPIMIHRGILGSLERFIGIMIEHFGGAFPLWLSPVQIQIIPISDKFNDYTKKVKEKFVKENLRVEIDDRSESLGKKIREAELAKIPYMLIVGEKEMKADSVAVRHLQDGDIGIKKTTSFVKEVVKERDNRE